MPNYYLLAMPAQRNYLLSASYAIAASFTVYAVFRFKENAAYSASGIVGGVTLTGALYVSACFLLGCCGSPLLAVYMGAFGSHFPGFSKEIVLAVTVISTVFGYVWMQRKTSLCDERLCDGKDSG